MGSFYSEKYVTARKDHICAGCLTKINKGEKYLKAAGVWDGSFWSEVFHPECRAYEMQINDLAGTQEGEWMCLHEIISECSDSLDEAPEIIKQRFKRRNAV